MGTWKLRSLSLILYREHRAPSSISTSPLLRRFSKQSSSPDNSLVSNVASILTHHRSKSRWNRVRTIYPHGFTPSQVSRIVLLLRNNPHLAHRFFFWTHTNSLCNHTLLSYATIIHTLARSRRLNAQAKTLIRSALTIGRSDGDNHSPDSSELPKLFETLVKTYRSCDSAPLVFDWLITSCLSSSRIDQALEIALKLLSRGAPLRVSTCNSLVHFISKHKGSDFGYALYRDIFHGFDSEDRKIRVKVCPNVHTFSDLMTCFYQEGMIDKLEEIWGEMIKSGCHPNACSYSVYMAACCEEGNMDMVESLWKDMSFGGVKLDIVAYNTVIDGFCRSCELCNAEELFKEMTINKIEPTCVTYQHLIVGYCKIGDVDSALVLCKDMRRKGFKPEASIIDMVVRKLCDEGRIFEAVKQFRFVMKDINYLLPSKCHEHLIKRLGDEGEVDEALQLQDEMMEKGYRLSPD